LLIGSSSPSFRYSFAEEAQAAASIGFSLVIPVLLAKNPPLNLRFCRSTGLLRLRKLAWQAVLSDITISLLK
jgi:hypothetical protein